MRKKENKIKIMYEICAAASTREKLNPEDPTIPEGGIKEILESLIRDAEEKEC